MLAIMKFFFSYKIPILSKIAQRYKKKRILQRKIQKNIFFFAYISYLSFITAKQTLHFYYFFEINLYISKIFSNFARFLWILKNQHFFFHLHLSRRYPEDKPTIESPQATKILKKDIKQNNKIN